MSQNIDTISLKFELENSNITLIDVRENHEVAEGFIPSAIHIPLGEISASRVEELKPEGKIVLYCKGGVRSSLAIQKLITEEFDGELINYTEGYMGWIANGLATAK